MLPFVTGYHLSWNILTNEISQSTWPFQAPTMAIVLGKSYYSSYPQICPPQYGMPCRLNHILSFSRQMRDWAVSTGILWLCLVTWGNKKRKMHFSGLYQCHNYLPFWLYAVPLSLVNSTWYTWMHRLKKDNPLNFPVTELKKNVALWCITAVCFSDKDSKNTELCSFYSSH